MMSVCTQHQQQLLARSKAKAPSVLLRTTGWCRRSAILAASAADDAAPVERAAAAPPTPSRRRALALAAALSFAAPKPARAAAVGGGDDAIEVVSDDPGTGAAEARGGDLVLVHLTGVIDGTDVVFDTTKGLGLTYRDGGPGALRPLAIRLDGYPVPGVCLGLQRALVGMRVGGRRTVVIPAGPLSFGQGAAAAPYAVVPAGAAVRYEIELLRLSRKGPDLLFSGTAKCGQGGASAAVDGCANIPLAEFV